MDALRSALLIPAVSLLASCATEWHPVPLQPERFQVADSAKRYQLILATGETLVVRAPVIRRDTLTGMQVRAAALDSLEAVQFPLSAIQGAAERVDRQDIVVTGVRLTAQWNPVTLQPELYRSPSSAQLLRLTLTSGDTLTLRGPVIRRDTLVGMRVRTAAAPPDKSLQVVNIPVTAISQAAEAEDRGDVGLFGVGVIVATLAAVVVMLGEVGKMMSWGR